MTESAPELYLAEPNLETAAEVAVHLNKPLLLTGPPGTGKTRFADYLARKHGLGAPLKFETKSVSQARDLFYDFDSLGRFHAAHDAEASRHNLDYITFNALGLAFLYSCPPDAVKDLLPVERHPGQRRSLVLIDEIDKAPTDFPNDLLNEIEHKYFVLPELKFRKVAASADSAFRPIVVITSNEEKNLPDAFLRRCVFYRIERPDRERLGKILLANRMPRGRLLESALDFYERVSALRLDKAPATSELLDWVQALLRLGADPEKHLKDSREILRGTLGVLAKKRSDQDSIRALMTQEFGPLEGDAQY